MRIIRWKHGRPTRGGDLSPQITSISVTGARLGQTVAVTIRGANFRNCPSGSAPQVTFGGVAATSVVVVDSSTITAVTPVATEPGVVDVTVTVGCCS